MARIGELDIPDRLAPFAPRWVIEIAFGLLCAGSMILVRLLVDIVAPAAGPYSLGYPAVLLATLFSGWISGLFASAAMGLYGWFALLPYQGSFLFENPQDGPRTAVNILAYGFIVLIADRFRIAVRNAARERDRQIAERDLFLAEFEHRVKNNFAIVASLIEVQRRRAQEPATVAALSTTLTRVESIARAHRHLYSGGTATGAVDMGPYLEELCAALAEALFLSGAIRLHCEVANVAMARDRAVPIGLVVNELVTNAAKHAFPGRSTGLIRVVLEAAGPGWRLTVSDDGVGYSPGELPGRKDGGLGQRLIDAFARQAGGTLHLESGASGTRAILDLDP